MKKLLLVFLILPAATFAQYNNQEILYGDTLAKANESKIKTAVINYFSSTIVDWKTYETAQWGISSVYSKYDDTPGAKEFGKKSKPILQRHKLYSDSIKYITSSISDNKLHYKNLSDSSTKYNELTKEIYKQYIQSKKLFIPTLKYYIVDYIIKKKNSIEKDAEVYSMHVTPDYQVLHPIHLRKDQF